jgi:hypothetical protein
VWARKRVIDDLNKFMRHTHLGRCDFVEALCRVAEMKSLPTNEELANAKLQPTQVVRYLEKMDLGHVGINGLALKIEPPPAMDQPKVGTVPAVCCV